MSHIKSETETSSVTSDESDKEEKSVDSTSNAEEREKRDKVMKGSLEEIPPLSSKIVRIFISSTFTDTTVERNALMEDVYPKLKEYCREQHGLEFQVVDMRWGIRDEATDDHSTTDLCMNEIDNCQRLSMGPNFVVLLGQKYGYRPLPTTIPWQEFDLIRNSLKADESDTSLLDTWYIQDFNSVPSVYVLQQVSSIITNFNNKRNQRLSEAAQNTWWDTHNRLQKLFRKAAQVLFIARKFDRDRMHFYYMSVTEREVERGILKSSNAQDHTLAYIRDINNINTSAFLFASKFVDFVSHGVDSEAQKLLLKLKDDKLNKCLPEENVARFAVEWTGREGISRETHADYIAEICDHFYKSVTSQVKRAMLKHEQLSNDMVYGEVLQHLHACEHFCRSFQACIVAVIGREETVKTIQQYVNGDINYPLVLYGESGCGKTSLMAKAARQMTSWVSHACEPALILRFLGTTPNSSSIVPLLTSICQQLCYIYNQNTSDIPDELPPLIIHFKKLIACADEKKPLAIFFDSLDQLSGVDSAHKLAWLPVMLPTFCKIIVSTLPNYCGILDALKKTIPIPECYVEIPPLGENLSSVILKRWLGNVNRDITEGQWHIVNYAISQCNLPLYVKLVFDEICRWKSYTKPDYTVLKYTIHESITRLFERIETQHGKTLVSHALGYITASKSGLSEAELEDLLSLDEKVLNDVYQYHIPPVRRIPALLWTRIRNDMPGYLSEREADGVNVIGWYHRQFIDAAKERYFKNLNFVNAIHSNTVDYFFGTWGGGRPKPFEYSEQMRLRFLLDERRGESDRKVPPQPLVFTEKSGTVIRYNLRKLNELPHHLIRSHRYEDLFEKVIFNYEWLHAKVTSMPLNTLLFDFEDLLSHTYDKDVKLLGDAIRLSSSILSHYPDMLGAQISGRLLPLYQTNHNIRELIDHCDRDCPRACALVPVHHCLHTPGGPLQYSLEGHHFAPFGIAVTSDAKYLISVSNRFIIWDLNTGEIYRTVVPGVDGIMQNLHVTPDDKRAVSYTNNNQVVALTIISGDFIIINNPSKKPSEVTLGTGVSNENLVFWTEREWFLYSIDGQFVSRGTVHDDNIPLITVSLHGDNEVCLTWKSGLKDDDDMAFSVVDRPVAPFEFHSAIVTTKDMKTLYSCIELSDNAVVVYRMRQNRWRYDFTFENKEKIFSLHLSANEAYLIAAIAFGFKLWDLKTRSLRSLQLPSGIRNIPSRKYFGGMVVFTKGNHFVVAAVRKVLYVWDVKQGNLVKSLDAHFGRIIAITSVISDSNAVISSSIDKTIKMWNFNNILEEVHSIDRHEKAIESLHIATLAPIAVTTTRNGIGMWNLETGKLIKTFGTTSPNAIIKTALCTSKCKYIVAAETNKIVFRDVANDSSVEYRILHEIRQLLMIDHDESVGVFSTASADRGYCTCLAIPTATVVFQFQYSVRTFINAIKTSDEQFLVVPTLIKSHDAVSIYNTKTGALVSNVQIKFGNFLKLESIVAMPREANLIAIIDAEKGYVIDVKKKTTVRSINRWNGLCTSSGAIGLHAPSRGGLVLVDTTKHGGVLRTLIPRVAEGVFHVLVQFTTNDKHAVYYHSGHRTIRVFRVSDGEQIANYKAHADVNVMQGTPCGDFVCIGCVDGSLTVLAIVEEGDHSPLSALPSREKENSPRQSRGSRAESDATKTMETALHVARFIAKARSTQRSRACHVS